MTEPEIQFAERLSRRNLRRAVILVGAVLAIVVGAAVTMGASPSTSTATPGSTAQPQASDPGTPDNGPWKGLGRGDFGGRGRFGPITITAISGSSLSLETKDGWTRTIAITSATAITKDGETIAASDLAVGDEIRLRQGRASDGTFTIAAIEVIQPMIGGTVTSVTTDSITVTGRDGASHTLATSNSTTYRLGGAAASRSDVVVGSKIVATGSAGTGDSFTATTVTIKAPRVAGTVTALTASTITIQQRDGSSLTIHVDADTTVGVAGNKAAALGDVSVGMRLIAAGRPNADGSFDATAIRAGNGRFHRGKLDQDDAGQPSPSTSPTTTG